MLFVDRVDAGRRLAEKLGRWRGADVVVLGLPRGWVPVAFEVAQGLDAPLDVILVRKLGVPYRPELAMGAIGEDGVRVIDDEVVLSSGVSDLQLAAVERRERAELERRAERLRRTRPRAPLGGRTVVIVDDGIATGSTARAACRVARAHGAARVVVAVPVAPPGWTRRLSREADEFACLATPRPFYAIGEWYWDFSPTNDAEVATCLERNAAARKGSAGGGTQGLREVPSAVDADVEIDAGPVRLAGHLSLPLGTRAVVVFAHGTGSSRHSSRNRFVARMLNKSLLGTLLFDLLTEPEAGDRANVFDIELLAQRLLRVTDWLRVQPTTRHLEIGYFGASTGAAAALWAAAEPGVDVRAVVSRGGRPDLAEARLAKVRAPTLLIVGAHDETVLALNRAAQSRLRCPSHVAVVPGATHLFEEPGALEQAGELARNWFLSYFSAADEEPVAARLDPAGRVS